MKALLLIVLLIPAAAMADDINPSSDGKHFSVMFKSTETNITEGAWQALNVVDMMQTIQIAKHPSCYQEVGTLSYLDGNHPSFNQAVWGSVLFAGLHYGTAKLLEAAADAHPNLKWVQRVYQYTGLAYKSWNDNRNRKIGLGLTSARGC